MPYLLPLLTKYDGREVRKLASYVLSDAEGLTEEHLDTLIESRRQGDVWIPPAIARVGTSKAITFLVEEVKKANLVDNQLVTAFQILSERGVPYLVGRQTGSLNYGAECGGEHLRPVRRQGRIRHSPPD